MTRSGVGLTLCLLVLVLASCAAWADPAVRDASVEGDAGTFVSLGRGGQACSVFVQGYGGRWETTGTLVWLPRGQFEALCAHALRALDLVPPSAPPDTAQTIFAAPVVLKDGVGGVVMLSVTRPSEGEPFVTIFAKRGDEAWDSRATFSGSKLQALLRAIRRLVG